jgi:hypothetical protein
MRFRKRGTSLHLLGSKDAESGKKKVLQNERTTFVIYDIWVDK